MLADEQMCLKTLSAYERYLKLFLHKNKSTQAVNLETNKPRNYI